MLRIKKISTIITFLSVLTACGQNATNAMYLDFVENANSDGAVFQGVGLGYRSEVVDELKNIVIPNDVSLNGKTYKVVSIDCARSVRGDLFPSYTESLSMCENIIEVTRLDYTAQIKTINFSSNLEKINHMELNNNTIENIIIPSKVYEINYSFYDCENLKTIIIPKSVKVMGDCLIKNRVDFLSTSVFCEHEEKPNGYGINGGKWYWYSETKFPDGKHWHYENGKPVIWQ